MSGGITACTFDNFTITIVDESVNDHGAHLTQNAFGKVTWTLRSEA